MKRVNIGCCMTPTKGWHNYDNSPCVILSSFPVTSKVLHRLKVINESQMAFISFCQQCNIEWADATKRIPLQTNSVDVLYSSHMIEHLDRTEANIFLNETKRVLTSGGIIRIAIPDIEKRVMEYINHGDADLFIESTYMCVARARTLSERIRIFAIGTRHHHWMYDSKSLCKLVTNSGFIDARSFLAGDTRISNPAPLDLYEREDESIYVEAIKP